MKRWLAILLGWVLLLYMPVAAEGGGYFVKDYPFARLQKILVVTSSSQGGEYAELFRTLLTKFPEQVQHKLERKKFQADLLPAVLNEYKELTGKTPTDLQAVFPRANDSVANYEEKDAEGYRKHDMYAFLSERYDAILLAHIAGVDTARYRSPGYTETRPEVYRLPVYNKDGELIGYDSYVTYETYYNPPRMYEYRRVAVMYTLLDAKTGRVIGRHAYLRDGTIGLQDLVRKTAGSYASLLEDVKKGKK